MSSTFCLIEKCITVLFTLNHTISSDFGGVIWGAARYSEGIIIPNTQTSYTWRFLDETGNLDETGFVNPNIRYSEGSLFRRFIIPKVRFSENEIGFDIPKVR